MELDCNVCERPAKHACGRCEIARYCSQECADLDWNDPEDPHKAWCFDAENPDPAHLNALIIACGVRNKKEGEEEEEEMPNADEDIDAAYEWLHVELEYPFGLELVEKKSGAERAEGWNITKAKGEGALGKAQIAKGKFQKGLGKLRGKKKQIARGEKSIAAGKAKKESARLKKKDARKRKRKARKKRKRKK